MEKQLENPEKKKKAKQPSRPSSAQRARAPAPPDRWAPPVSGGFCPACFPPPSLCPVGPTCRRQLFSPPRAPLPSPSRGAALPDAEPLPRAPFSLSAPWAFPVNSAVPAPAVDQRARTRVSRRDPRPRRSAHAPAPFEPPPVPPLTPLPHFTQSRPRSRSAHAARPRRRPAPASPAI
jgi:hypothetical protein